jgi:hypothetical protein
MYVFFWFGFGLGILLGVGSGENFADFCIFGEGGILDLLIRGIERAEYWCRGERGSVTGKYK